MRMRPGRAKDVYAFVALFSLWTGDGMRDLLSWWGFSVLSLGLLVGAIVILVRRRARLRRLLRRSTSWPLLVFLAVCLLSLVWSAYPAATLLGCVAQLSTTVVAVALVLLLPVSRLITVFALVIHTNLALSVVFEVVVALLPGHTLEPFFTSYGAGSPGAFAWSQGLLFTGQRIQGIVGNANLTCFIGLIGVILIGCLLSARRIAPRIAVPALVLDVVMMALTRSATVLICSATVAAAVVLVLAYRHIRGHGRILLTAGAVLIAGLAALSTSRLADPVLRLLGKGDDFTGRLEIWHIVGGLVAQRPVLGWGFVGWWVPWVAPFDGRVVRGGVTYLQAHNAYLDVEFQVGVLGLLALALLTGSVAYRALHLAAARAPLSILPLLLVAALLTQALAESRLLIEGDWTLLAMLSVLLPWGRHHRVSPEHGTIASRVLTG